MCSLKACKENVLPKCTIVGSYVVLSFTKSNTCQYLKLKLEKRQQHFKKLILNDLGKMFNCFRLIESQMSQLKTWV